jgi:hypothetical protein
MLVPVVFLLLVLLLLVATPVVQWAALGLQRHIMRRTWRSLDKELLVEPPVAYKTAQVVVTPDGGHATLVGITTGVAYPAVAAAVCPRRRCDPPGLDCSCGFYAFKRRSEAVALLHETLAFNGLRHKVLLTVMLEGEVLQYERGYRAQRQTVLGVEFSALCHRCEQQGTRRTAELLATAASSPRPFTTFGGHGPSGWPATALPLRPVCSDHVPASSLTMNLAVVAGLLGTDVHWLAAPESAAAGW